MKRGKRIFWFWFFLLVGLGIIFYYDWRIIMLFVGVIFVLIGGYHFNELRELNKRETAGKG